MNSWFALCRREWLEHRTAIGWTPLIALGVMIALALLVGLSNDERTLEFTSSSATSGDGAQPGLAPGLIAGQLATMIDYWCRPLTWLYLIITSYTLLGSLFDERRDRTILFWKSMPTTDTQVVLSKLVVIVGAGAIVSAAVIQLSQWSLITLSALLLPDELGVSTAHLLAAVQPGEQILLWSFGYFTQIFWSLPLWGWLLLMSSTATRRPALWAVLLPLVVMLLEWAALDTTQLVTSALAHMRLLALPTIGNDTPTQLSDIAALWASADMWQAIVIGALMIAGAIYVRRRSNEL